MKKLRGTLFGSLLVGAAVLAMSASSAYAALTLRLSAGGSSVEVTDNLAGDINSAVNSVLFFGSVDGWTINVATAVSKGVGFALDVTTSQTSSSSAGTLTIEVSDTGFGSPSGSAKFLMNASYTLPSVGGSVNYTAYQSNSNSLFQTDTLIGSILLNGNGFVGGSAGANLSGLTNPYSLTQVVVVTHNGAGLSTGDSELRVPEPGTLGLLGVGLMLLGLMGRYRKVLGEATAK